MIDPGSVTHIVAAMEQPTKGREEVVRLEEEIAQLKAELVKARAALQSEPIDEYMFETPGGAVSLSDLFGDKDKLLVVHNMGRGCAYCTLWADGFVGMLPHIETAASFVIVSPDDPATQASLPASRNSPFRMASDQSHAFTRAAGYRTDTHVMPGVSAFVKDADGRIYRTSHTRFGPGDDFSPIWHMWDLFGGAAGDWRPRV